MFDNILPRQDCCAAELQRKMLKNNKCLLQKDVTEHEDYLIVFFRYSKTIQFGERILQTPLIKIPGSILCPAAAYKRMRRMISTASDDPLFSLPNKKCIFLQ